MNITKNMVPIAEFIKLKNISEDRAIEMIRNGFYVGRKIDDKWYVSLDEIENENIIKNHKSVSIVFRIVFALFTAPGIGVLISFLITRNVTNFEGTKGYAFLYYSAIFISINFLYLLFITREKTMLILGLISIIGWLVVVILG